MPPFRIMIVEDDRHGADSFAMLLRTWGYAVQVAYDAESALANTDTSPPDVVLSDINMPEMDGFSLAEQLAGKGISLIATTADGDEATRQHSYEVGFQHHFVKPVDLLALHRVLEHYRKAS